MASSALLLVVAGCGDGTDREDLLGAEAAREEAESLAARLQERVALLQGQVRDRDKLRERVSELEARLQILTDQLRDAEAALKEQPKELARTPHREADSHPEVTTEASPEGTVEIVQWNNHLPYDESCAQVIVRVANRSDTALKSLTIRFEGETASEEKVDLGERIMAAGIAPFASGQLTYKVCDERLAGRQFGPAAVPTSFYWEWFTKA